MLRHTGWRVVALLILNLALASCGSEVTTQPQISAAPAIVPTSAPPATSPTTTATPTTPAVTTPQISSGLTKGKLKEVFPILAQLPEAKTVRMNPILTDMAVSRSADYDLSRRANDFSGLGLFRAYYYSNDTYEEAREINVPMADMQRYLAMLAETPVEEGPYKGPPLQTVTDYYPGLAMEIDTETGTLMVSSNSQKPDFFPWTLTFAGRTFTATDATPFQAYSILKPYLKEDVFEEISKRAWPDIQSRTPTPTPAIIQTLNPLHKSQEWTFSEEGNLAELAISPDNNIVAGNLFAGKIHLWTLDGHLLRTLDIGRLPLSVLAFSPDSKYLYGTLKNFFYHSDLLKYSGPNLIRRWEVATGKELPALVDHSTNINALAISSDGKLLASASDYRTVRLWSLPDGKNIATLQAKLPEIYSLLAVAFSPDNKRIVAAGRGDPTTKNFPIKIWSVSSGQEEITLRGHAAPVQTLAFTPDGKTMVSADEAGTIILWDTGNWRKRQIIENKLYPYSLSMSRDGKWLVGAYGDGGMRLWEVATGKLVSVTQVTKSEEHPGYGPLFKASISSDGRYIVTNAEKILQKWDL
jgi:WD40 repeat protein